MATKRTHSLCTLKNKTEVLRRLDKGESMMKLSIEFGTGKQMVSDWEKIQSKIQQFWVRLSSEALEHTSMSMKFLSIHAIYQKFHFLIKLMKLFFFVFFKKRH